MRHSRLIPSVSSAAGFTLVEVSLAIGVAAIAILALLGMTSMGVQIGRLAVDDTITATIAQDIFAGLRGQEFSALASGTATFDRNGDPNTTNPHYKCLIEVTKNGNYSATVRLTFVWPNVNNFTQSPSTNSFFTRIPNYTPF